MHALMHQDPAPQMFDVFYVQDIAQASRSLATQAGHIAHTEQVLPKQV